MSSAVMPPGKNALECRDLRKVYMQGKVEVQVLLGVNLALAHGEHVAIVGASGSGKSTLLHLLGGLDAATGGERPARPAEASATNHSTSTRTRQRSRPNSESHGRKAASLSA